MTKGEHEQYRPLPCVSLATWNLLSNLPTSQHRFLVRYADTHPIVPLHILVQAPKKVPLTVNRSSGSLSFLSYCL